jgi:hypothetical protein
MESPVFIPQHHHAGLDLDAELAPEMSAPPGENPFHVKGVVPQALLGYLERRVPGGLDAAFAQLGNERIRAFFRQTFLAATWYDMIPVLHLLRAAARAACVPTPAFAAEHAAWHAARDTRGIFRLLLLVASPEAVAKRLGVAYGRYFDYAIVTSESVSEGRSVVLVRGMPSLFVPWYRVAMDAGAASILRVAGARNIQSAYTALEPDGFSGPVPLVRFHSLRTWTRLS